MAANSQDKIVFGAAAVALLASVSWTMLQSSKLDELRASSEVAMPASEYAPVGIDAPRVTTKTWPDPAAQSTGPKWIYDVFTPPEIYYDSASKQFTVSEPRVGPIDVVDKPFGVELVEVRPDVFALQLVGYIGEAEEARGNFVNTVTGDTIIGRSGKKISELGLTIKEFKVEKITIRSEGSMDTYITVASAVVVDDKTGDQVTLTNRERYIQGAPFAVLKVTGSNAEQKHKEGARFTIDDVSYTVARITEEPPSVEIVKESPELKEPVKKTLTPAQAPAPVTPPAEENSSDA